MQSIEQIKTLQNFHEEKLKEKGSIFIGQSFPINSEEEITNILIEIKKEYYDATHHCYAYRLIDNKYKYSDAGEPTGTAGIRILNAIDHFELVNVLVVIIRYFGGTKLGVGPLGKAYFNSAKLVLEKAKHIDKKAYKKVDISSEFSLINHIHRILSNFSAIIESSSFEDQAKFSCLIEIKNIEKVKIQLQEISKGNIKIKENEKILFY